MRSRAFAILLALSSCPGVGDGVAAEAEPSPQLLADLGFRAECPRRPADDALFAIERKMVDAGFDVLDTAEVANEQRAYYPYPVKIDALDKAGRIISLITLPPPGASDGEPFKIHVALYSRPPTRRDAALEAALTGWMTEGLGCTAQNVHRDDNGAAALPVYERTLDTTRGWFKEAREMKAGPRALLKR